MADLTLALPAQPSPPVWLAAEHNQLAQQLEAALNHKTHRERWKYTRVQPILELLNDPAQPFGWQALPALILMSSVVGAVLGGAMLVFRRKSSDTAFPFGPYIVGAGLIVLFFGADVLPLTLVAGH